MRGSVKRSLALFHFNDRFRIFLRRLGLNLSDRFAIQTVQGYKHLNNPVYGVNAERVNGERVNGRIQTTSECFV